MEKEGRESYQRIDHYHMAYLTIQGPNDTLQICRSGLKAHMANDLAEPNLQGISASDSLGVSAIMPVRPISWTNWG